MQDTVTTATAPTWRAAGAVPAHGPVPRREAVIAQKVCAVPIVFAFGASTVAVRRSGCGSSDSETEEDAYSILVASTVVEVLVEVYADPSRATSSRTCRPRSTIAR